MQRELGIEWRATSISLPSRMKVSHCIAKLLGVTMNQEVYRLFSLAKSQLSKCLASSNDLS